MRKIFDRAARAINAGFTPEVNGHSVYKRCHVKTIVFDQRIGRGATSVNRRLASRGFVAMMTPSQYFALADQAVTDEKKIAGHIKWMRKGRSVASPYLYVDFDRPLPWVMKHKGHNRMHAILECYGDIPVPVIIRPNPRGKTALYHITEKHLVNLRGPVYTERGGLVSPTGIERLYLHGKKMDMNAMLRSRRALALAR